MNVNKLHHDLLWNMQGLGAGVEIALWDIKGKKLGVPVHELLGGKLRDKIRIYCDCHSGAFWTGEDYGRRWKEVRETGKLDPVYDKLYYSTPMFTKILAQAALPYIYTGLMAGMKIFLPRMQKMADKKEVRILRSLIDHQAIDENRDLAPIEIPYSYEDLCVL